MDEDLDELDDEAVRVQAARAERERRLDEVAVKGTRRPAEPDILVIVDGFVPVYNPSPYPVELRGGGDCYHVRPQGIDMVSEMAAQVAIGEGFGATPKPLSKIGVRRLRQPHENLRGAAERAGFRLEAWVLDQNRQIIEEAAAAWEAAQHDEHMDVSKLTAVVNAAERADAPAGS